MLTFTERARSMVLTYMGEGDSGFDALRVRTGGSPLAPEYELTLVGPEERAEGDVELDLGDFRVFVEQESGDRLEGATVDFVERVNESGFEVRPVSTAPAAPKHGPPEGPIADRVREILESQVNPSIASHGGAINLVGIEGTEIYMEMTGGCQGCAMSRMTLRQGVERMIRQAVPEITAVHDITDHAGGENPFFQ